MTCEHSRSGYCSSCATKLAADRDRWHSAWIDQRKATGRAWWSGHRFATRPSRGEMINRRAYVGSQVVALRARVPELEKLARRTPPKTLVAEKARVDEARRMLPICRAQLAELETEWGALKTTLNEGGGT